MKAIAEVYGRPASSHGIIKALFIALLALLTVTMALAPPAKAQSADREGLVAAGPIDPESGYPYWYEDENGLRLDLCLDPQDQMCLQPFEMPDPNAPVSFPDNFPGESFWWSGEAATTTTTGGDAQLSMAMEAAWGGADEAVRDGNQISFGRIRVRIDGLSTGSEYRVVHPYGVENFGPLAVEDEGEINYTADLGCLTGALAKCDFNEALAGDVGPFLRWDPAVAPAAPDGYVGNPDAEHKVVGSSIEDPSHASGYQNYFEVQELNAINEWVTVAETDQFAVSGKMAELQIKPEPVGAERGTTVFNDAQQKIKLVASDPDAEVYYTTDGSPVTEQSASYVHSEDPSQGIDLNSDPNAPAGTKTTVNYLAVSEDEQRVEGSKTFEVDIMAPNLTVSEPAGTYDEASKDIALTTNERARVYYTTDGSNPDPRGDENPARESFVYDPSTPEADQGNIVHLNRSQTIRAIAVDLDPATGDPVNWGQPRSFAYTIAALKAAGPINPLGGYPYWYEDQNGLRLDLCLDPGDVKCVGEGLEMPDPNAPVSFPDNFPGESFWWSGEADLALPGSKKSILVMAHEAAWGGADEAVRDGDQIVFGRIRVRIDGLQLGREYRVSHPYGTDTYVAEDDGKGAGEINVTEDLGCGELGPVARCDFNEARFGRVGPFLTWDTFGQGTEQALQGPNGEADAYVGDPSIPHKATGSPIEDPSHASGYQNYFRLEQRDGNGWEEVAQTDEFAISGKVSGLRTDPSVPGGTFNEPQNVSLFASDPAARIFFTTNGDTPSQASALFDPNDPIRIASDTTLKFVAVDPAGNQSDVVTQDYVIDTTAPTVEANPGPGTFSGPQQVTLTANDEDVAPAGLRTLSSKSSDGNVDQALERSVAGNETKIYYTTDGSEPTTNSALYRDPIRVDETRTIKAIAVDAAGNRSEVASFEYTIDGTAPNAPTASVPEGSFDAARRVTLRTADPTDTIHYTIDGSDPTTDSATYGDPLTISKTTTLKFFSVDVAGNRSETVTQEYVIRKASRVSLNVSKAKLKLGKSRVISGKVLPAHGGKVVKMTVERNGKPVMVRNLRLNGASVYGLAYKPKSVGRYSVQVRFVGDSDHKPGLSVTKSFRVVRR